MYYHAQLKSMVNYFLQKHQMTSVQDLERQFQGINMSSVPGRPDVSIDTNIIICLNLNIWGMLNSICHGLSIW